MSFLTAEKMTTLPVALFKKEKFSLDVFPQWDIAHINECLQYLIKYLRDIWMNDFNILSNIWEILLTWVKKVSAIPQGLNWPPTKKIVFVHKKNYVTGDKKSLEEKSHCFETDVVYGKSCDVICDERLWRHIGHCHSSLSLKKTIFSHVSRMLLNPVLRPEPNENFRSQKQNYLHFFSFSCLKTRNW